ncbi:hypothetical protein [Xanthomonas campestris]|uniref:hypothetical protein n=1 Tax=Xanthomonas campestris TaxID=339 RepID=UPI0015F29BFB|nr:hypothetical protein [Xanthomonas campestris]MEA9569629.1 hypothetical protein [Xanthomonas campestris]MEA9627454.1 hypothetical protein [Xanthomonas campestris]MEA9630861.1 hypothetical protein [Xanthomonas campestris]MEB1694830.1 hypothetical protein [Xanthomonas campestris pv. campestris]
MKLGLRIQACIEYSAYGAGIVVFVAGKHETASCLLIFACYWRLQRYLGKKA